MDTSLSRILDPIPSTLRKDIAGHRRERIFSSEAHHNDRALHLLKPVEYDQSFDPRAKPPAPAARPHESIHGPYDIAERSFTVVEPMRELIDGKWQKRKLQMSIDCLEW